MNLAPMRYKDYVWPHNPETYTISFQRKVAVAKVPFGRYGMQEDVYKRQAMVRSAARRES